MDLLLQPDVAVSEPAALVHVFQALPRLSPEAAKAMAQVARFIDTSRRANGFDAIAGKAG